MESDRDSLIISLQFDFHLIDVMRDGRRAYEAKGNPLINPDLRSFLE